VPSPLLVMLGGTTLSMQGLYGRDEPLDTRRRAVRGGHVPSGRRPTAVSDTESVKCPCVTKV